MVGGKSWKFDSYLDYFIVQKINDYFFQQTKVTQIKFTPLAVIKPPSKLKAAIIIFVFQKK